MSKENAQAITDAINTLPSWYARLATLHKQPAILFTMPDGTPGIIRTMHEWRALAEVIPLLEQKEHA